MYEKLIVDTESPSGLRWVSGRNKGKPAGCRAKVSKAGKVITKNFKKLDDAIEWLKEKRRELHGEFACN